jgi:ABC-type amino acid transport system permease subunit
MSCQCHHCNCKPKKGCISFFVDYFFIFPVFAIFIICYLIFILIPLIQLIFTKFGLWIVAFSLISSAIYLIWRFFNRVPPSDLLD